MDKAVIELVESELDFRVLYCIGHECGPLAGLVTLGVSSRKSLFGAFETAQRWWPYPRISHFEHVISGEWRLMALKARLEARWSPKMRGSWWEKSGQAAALEIVALAADQGVPLLTEAEAVEMETELREIKRAELMSRMAGV